MCSPCADSSSQTVDYIPSVAAISLGEVAGFEADEADETDEADEALGEFLLEGVVPLQNDQDALRTTSVGSAEYGAPVYGGTPKLRNHLEPGMLRALPLATLLSRFGRHLWIGSTATEQDYAQSILDKPIDDFLSHDWGTSGVEKYLSLLVLYNSRAAFMAGLLTMPFVLLLEWFFPDVFLFNTSEYEARDGKAIRIGPLWIVAMVVYWVVLLQWQAVREVAKVGKGVFLDKLCICQTDVEKKRDGIASLAGFLKESKRIVIAYSTRYISRIWCTFELASWINLQKD